MTEETISTMSVPTRLTDEQIALLTSIADNPKTLTDVRRAIRVALTVQLTPGSFPIAPSVDRLSDEESERANAMLDIFAPVAVRSAWEPSERRTIVRAMLAYGDAVAGITNTIRDAAAAVSFRSMDEWDKRDEIVMLLVDYREGEHSLDDALVAITVGHNNDHNVGDGEGSGWQFAGWLWSQDCYTQGEGKPIGWLPLSEYHEYARGIEEQMEAA